MSVVYRLEFGRKPTLMCPLGGLCLRDAIFHPHTKFGAEISIRGRDMPENEIQNGDRLRLLFPVLVLSYTQNFSKIGQSASVLIRFNHFQYGRRHIGVYRKWNSTIPWFV